MNFIKNILNYLISGSWTNQNKAIQSINYINDLRPFEM